MAKTTRTPDEQIARLKAEVKRLNERLGAEIRTNDENSAMLRAERQNTAEIMQLWELYPYLARNSEAWENRTRRAYGGG